MIYLLLFVLTAVASTHWLRFAQGRRCNIAWLGAWTYLTAAACTAGWLAARRQAMPLPAVAYGLAGGLALGLTYLSFFLTIKHFGVGVGHLTRQMALVVPVLASIFIWSEKVPLARGVGLAMVFVALPLMSRPTKRLERRAPSRLVLLPASLLVLAGLTNTLTKAYAALEIPGASKVYLLFLLLGAGSVSLLYAAGGRIRPQRRDLLFGLVLGLDNALLNYSRVRLVETEEGVKAFPAMSLGVILVSIVLAMVLWKERFRGRVLVGVALALLALALILLPIEKWLA